MRRLSDVSPQLQVLAMGLSWALHFCQKMVERCVRLAGFSADALLMDRHRAPAMTRDSFCFGVYVDGVGAVGCNRPKVLAALEAVKAALDAAGLQCSEFEADTSKQLFKGLQFDHETGMLSLEASRIWRLRHGLEFAARQKHLAGDQVARIIWHITWSCLLRRPALSLINAGYRFARTFGPRSGQLQPAVAQEFRWIASWLPCCRWIARPRMHSDVDQCETSTKGLTLTQSCLLFSLPKPRELRVKKCSLESLRGSAPPFLLHPRTKLSRRNPGSLLRSHAQRVSGLLLNDETRAEVVGKAGRDGGKEPKTRPGKLLYDGKQGRQMESELARPSLARAVFENFSAVGAGSASGALPRECLLQPPWW